MTFKRIGWRQIVAPAAGILAVLIVWWLTQLAYDQAAAGTAAVQAEIYKYHLLFGFDSAGDTLRWLFNRPLIVAVSLCGMLYALPALFRERYDPPAVVLFLFVPFLAYWWVFFTVGNIPRYLWYAIATAAAFSAPLIWDAVAEAYARRSRRVERLAFGALAVLLLLPTAYQVVDHAQRVYMTDDRYDDRALADYVRALPPDTTMATTFWPVQRELNFLAGRHIGRVKPEPAWLHGYDVIIVNRDKQANALVKTQPDRTIGRYALLLDRK
jgi:hypothetical protein